MQRTERITTCIQTTCFRFTLGVYISKKGMYECFTYLFVKVNHFLSISVQFCLGFFKVFDIFKRDICSFHYAFNSNSSYKISLEESKKKQLGLDNINGHCLLINIQCLSKELSSFLILRKKLNFSKIFTVTYKF